MTDDRFWIITGLSGSGKTVVSNFLEDLGYYRVDNLPVKLIPIFVNLWKRKEFEIEKVVLVVDIRETGFIQEFPRVLKSIRKVVSPRLLFLEASDDILVKRFSESRRPHPLKEKESILENVILERKRFSEIKKIADEVIDTSSTTIPELKKILAQRFLKRKKSMMQVVVISFGYKYGIPLDSDLVFDTRFLPNPFYIDELREKTGRSQKVKGYVIESQDTKMFLDELFRFLDILMPMFIEEGKSYVTISFGCTGGRHRSVVVAESIRNYLKGKNYKTRVYHRDVYR
ncbi:MAG: RNase adapter RapZ [Candidatus Aminicenantes bacterium]|nr:RNase adapter RapZ [Candidatus Aminicenantes bacterium]